MSTPDYLPQKTHRGRRILLWLAGLVALAVVGLLAFVIWTNSQVERIPDEELEALTAVTGSTRNFLLVGTDSREDLPEDFEGKFGDFSGERTDVIMLAHFENGRGQLLSIPRDLRVSIPGRGTDKINAAFVFGGPNLLIETVETNLDIDIHHYIEIDFLGFANTVDALGGVELSFPFDSRDLKSGFEIEAGTHVLNGEQAVAYARSRSFEELQPGGWTAVRANDFGRMGRQQELLLTMLDQAQSLGKVFNLPGFVSSFAQQVTTDDGLGAGTMLSLGRSLFTLGDDAIDVVTLPVRSVEDGGVSYVVLTEAANGVLFLFKAGEQVTSSQ